MKFFLVIWLIAFLSFFVINENKANELATEKIDFKILEEKYFKGIEYKYEDFVKKNVVQRSSLEIEKKNLSLDEFEKIRKKIIEDGWEQISYVDGYYEFCKNRNQVINILYPTKEDHYTQEGNKLRFENLNSWLVIFYYNYYGVDSCKRYYDNLNK